MLFEFTQHLLQQIDNINAPPVAPDFSSDLYKFLGYFLTTLVTGGAAFYAVFSNLQIRKEEQKIRMAEANYKKAMADWKRLNYIANEYHDALERISDLHHQLSGITLVLLDGDLEDLKALIVQYKDVTEKVQQIVQITRNRTKK